jgi:predicted small secreted protein
MILNRNETDTTGESGASILRALVFALLVAAATILMGCSTTEGFGKDVKHLGSNVEDSAARNK